MKIRTLAVAAFVSGLGAVVSFPLSASATGTARTVLAVDEVTTSFSYLHGGVVAQPTGASSVGDQIVFQSKLVLKKKTVGRGSVSCVFTGSTESSLVCTGVYTLPKGSVSFIGQGGQGALHLPIVGGTGNYVGARGLLVVKNVSATLAKDVFSFVTS